MTMSLGVSDVYVKHIDPQLMLVQVPNRINLQTLGLIGTRVDEELNLVTEPKVVLCYPFSGADVEIELFSSIQLKSNFWSIFGYLNNDMLAGLVYWHRYHWWIELLHRFSLQVVPNVRRASDDRELRLSLEEFGYNGMQPEVGSQLSFLHS